MIGKDFKTKVLVVDDSAFMRQFIIGYLHDGGFMNVEEATNGKMAIDMFKKDKPDIILLDLIMPVEDGPSALEKLVALEANVIIISAVGQERIMQEMLRRGAKGYFIKPFFSAEEISEKIRGILTSDVTHAGQD